MAKKNRSSRSRREPLEPRIFAKEVKGPKGRGVLLYQLSGPLKDVSGPEMQLAIVEPSDGTGQRKYVVGAKVRSEYDILKFTKAIPEASEARAILTTNFDAVLDDLLGRIRPREVDLSITSVVSPEKKTSEGVLIKSVSIAWLALLERLQRDWTEVYRLPPRFMEEFIAGAYDREGFDEVILTPRSNDHGRDIIAIKRGVGSVRILGSVKAYKPPHLVTRAEVHELMGVVASDPNASKGIFTTTSDFAPRLLADTRLAAAIPYRIELMNGEKLRTWLKSLSEKK